MELIYFWDNPSQLSSVQNSAQEVLYDRTFSSRPAKRVKFDTVSVADLPELVPDLPQAVVACETEELQDNGEIVCSIHFISKCEDCIVLTVYIGTDLNIVSLLKEWEVTRTVVRSTYLCQSD